MVIRDRSETEGDNASNVYVVNPTSNSLIEATIGTPVDTANTDSTSTTATLIANIKGLLASNAKIVRQRVPIDVTESDYVNADGFFIWIPLGFTGDIIATPIDNDVAETITAYSTDGYYADCLYKSVSTNTATKIGLIAGII